MSDLAGMSGVSYLRTRLAHVVTVLDAKLVRSSWMKTIESPVVAITVPGLVVLVVWLGSVLGLNLVWTQVVAMTLGLVLVTPFMRRATLCSTPTVTDDTLFIAPTNPAEDVLNSSVDQDYEGWSGPMGNSLSELSGDQLELIIELVDDYMEKADLTQNEWGEAQAIIDLVEVELHDR